MIKDIRRIIYLGGNDYKLRIGNNEIQVTEEDIEEFIKCVDNVFDIEGILEPHQNWWIDEDEDEDEDEEYYKNTRVYNKREKIIELFKSYYDDKKTKKEVFIQIADELSISFKAVEKAFYSKN